MEGETESWRREAEGLREILRDIVGDRVRIQQALNWIKWKLTDQEERMMKIEGRLKKLEEEREKDVKSKGSNKSVLPARGEGLGKRKTQDAELKEKLDRELDEMGAQRAGKEAKKRKRGEVKMIVRSNEKQQQPEKEKAVQKKEELAIKEVKREEAVPVVKELKTEDNSSPKKEEEKNKQGRMMEGEKKRERRRSL